MAYSLRKRKRTIPDYFRARKRTRMMRPVRRRTKFAGRSRFRRRRMLRGRRTKRVRLNRILRGVIRFTKTTTQSAAGEYIDCLQYSDVNTEVKEYLDRYKDIYQFFKVLSISCVRQQDDPDSLNTAGAKLSHFAKCYDADAHGRDLSATDAMNNFLRNPTTKRGVWKPGQKFSAYLKPHWPIMHEVKLAGGSGYGAPITSYNKKFPWFAIADAADIPTSGNAVHTLISTSSERTITEFWTVRLLLKGRDNDMQYSS